MASQIKIDRILSDKHENTVTRTDDQKNDLHHTHDTSHKEDLQTPVVHGNVKE